MAAAALAALVAGLALLWATGSLQALLWWAAGRQRDLQALLGGQLYALRAGEPVALWTLLGVCAAYGFVHALGPGHGKAIVGGAAVATRATAVRMATIAVLGSLAQAGVAVAIVFGALGALAATARSTVGAVDSWSAPLGNAAIAAVGAWLLWRGVRGLQYPASRGCAHGHSSDVVAAEGVGPGAALGMIAAMAARPCTGALLVLVIAWRLDLAAAGIAAVVAMGLGTAALTAVVAVCAVFGRDAAYLGAGDAGASRLLAPGLQLVAGGLIAAVSGGLLISEWLA